MQLTNCDCIQIFCPLTHAIPSSGRCEIESQCFPQIWASLEEKAQEQHNHFFQIQLLIILVEPEIYPLEMLVRISLYTKQF